jgi:hypothetical protein
MKNEKYSLFHIEGGLGKHIAATAVAKAIKNNHSDRKLIVVCAYPEIFLNLKYVDRVYRIGTTPYFYQDYILGNDSIIFKQEPYFTTEHIYKRQSLIETWCQTFNLEYKGETPELVFNYRQKQFAFKKWGRTKPVMVIQTNGGPISDQPFPYSWTRDIPQYITRGLIEYYKQTYHIIQICRSEENVIVYDGVEIVHAPMGNMELLSLLLVSQKQVLIDSCLQHAAAALNKPSTVLWIGTSPKVFGYGLHNNIQANLPEDFKLPDSYLFDYSFVGPLHECPVINEEDMFDFGDIISTI